MKIGLVFPQIEFPSDPAAISEYAQAVEAMGYNHLVAFDHVLGGNPDRPGGIKGPYSYRDPFQEPLVLFSYLAGLTQRIEFTTGIIILPQRQTALFAKQAATLDILSSGRLRVGIGLGWNAIEYEALNEDFHNRGKRIEEQVELLRRLWAEPLITFKGRWHTVTDAGLNPLPTRRSIPLWFGGQAEVVLQRTARLGDGWMSNTRNPADAARQIARVKGYREEAGLSLDRFGIEGRISYGDGDAGVWTHAIDAWRAAGATHLSLDTMRQGFDTPHKHLAAARLFADVAGISG